MKAVAIGLVIAAALGGALAGCASRGRKASSDGTASLVPAAALPERQRAVLDAWHQGGAAWEAEREKVAADPDLARFLVDNLVVEMVRAFDRSAISTAASPDRPFDRAQAELVRWAARSTPVLVELLGVHDGIVAYLAADTLTRIGTPAVAPVSAKLGAPEPETRRRAAELLGNLPPAGAGEPAVLEGLGALAERDPQWIVRAQAARALGARGARHAHKGYAAAVLARALADPDPEVVKSALDGLATLGESSAIPALIRSLERAARDGDLAALKAAQSALRKLTGETADHDPEEWWARWRARGAAPPANPGGSGG
jgi:hypothetical protein